MKMGNLEKIVEKTSLEDKKPLKKATYGGPIFVMYYSQGWNRICVECTECGKELAPPYTRDTDVAEWLRKLDDAIKDHVAAHSSLENLLKDFGWRYES